MPLPSAADQIVVQGFLLDEATGLGDTSATITSKPVPLDGQDSTRPLVLDTNDHVHIRTNIRSTKPDPDTGYWAVLALATNDPDLTAYGGREISLPGDEPRIIEVPWNAPQITVSAAMAAQVNGTLSTPLLVEGQQVRALWYHQAAGFTAPTPPSGYLTSSQTMSAIESGIDAHDTDGSAHPDIRALVQNASVADATTTTKGSAVILGGTAANPTVPYGKVTGAPTSLPPSGGAGGVLSGSYPAPGFAVDMATQAELDAHTGNTSNPHGTTKSQVGLGSVDNTADTAKPVSTAQQTALDGKATRSANLSDLASTSAARTNLGLSAVAASGAYTDLSGKPTIPTSYAQLSGTVPQSALPAVALTDFLGAVSSQSAMLALVGQRGDWATRTDRGSDWQLIADDYTQLASWREMSYPASPVSSVNGRTGAVTGLAEASDPRFTDTRTPTDASVTDAKVAPSAGIAESKLNLASDAAAGTASRRTLGTGAQQAAAGNDSRIVGAAPQSALTAHTTDATNPHAVSKSQVGLGNVDNTSDAAKPVSTAQQTALNGKQPLSGDLTAIAALSPADGSFIQRQSSSWTSRTATQVRGDIGAASSALSTMSAGNVSSLQRTAATEWAGA